MKDPQDYDGGVQEMIDSIGKNGSESYDDFNPLADRNISGIKINGGGEDTEAKLRAELAFSGLIGQMLQQPKKMWGFLKDAAIDSDLESRPIVSLMGLSDFIFNADCMNRKGRYDVEEKEADRWRKQIEDTEKVEELLHKWSEAAAFMLQAKIVEETHGIERARPLFDEFRQMKAQREQVELDASKLRPAENMFFWSRVRGYQILHEQAEDVAMGRPTHDFTDVKRKLAEGSNVHDVVHEMPWPWQLAHQIAVVSTSDGEAFRTMVMSAFSQTLPQEPKQTWAPPPYYPPPYMNGHDDEDAPDRRRSIFSFGRNGAQQEPEPKRGKSRRKGGRR